MHKNSLSDLYFHMLRIRRVEEAVSERYKSQQMRCPVHLCIGQEAIAVGVCAHLKKTDMVFSGHRSHGHYLAKGGSLRAMIAEFYGKSTGCSKGRGGSQHLIDLSVEFMGANPIVAETVPVAVGASFGMRLQKRKRVTVVFFGDAAVEEGVMHESLNYAALKKLPILFVCENNLYSTYTHIRQRQPKRPLYKIAAAHGIWSKQADGNDCLVVSKVAGQAISRIRRGQGPAFLEFSTYRYLEHVGPNQDPSFARPQDEVSFWIKRDPLTRLYRHIKKTTGQRDIGLENMEEKIKKEVDAAFDFAQKSPFPTEGIKEAFVYESKRTHTLPKKPQEKSRKLTYAQAICEALDQAMTMFPKVFVIGEGVPDIKGVFGTTSGLQEKFGRDRVMDMPVSENGMTGVCIGAALVGMRPVLIHPRVDFALLSFDQIVNNAAKWYYMFGGQSPVPLVIRMVIGRGWGQGAQHSQSLQAVFAHIPGLKVLMPASAFDAKGMLLGALVQNNPVIFIEHRWLHQMKGFVPKKTYEIEIGKARVVRRGENLTVVASSYMVVESMKAAKHLSQEKITAEVIDLRSVKPLDIETIVRSVKKTGRLVICDTGFESFGVASEVVAKVSQKAWGALKASAQVVALPNIPTPTSWKLAQAYYPTETAIIEKAMLMMGRDKKSTMKVVERAIKERTVPTDIPDQSFKGPF